MGDRDRARGAGRQDLAQAPDDLLFIGSARGVPELPQCLGIAPVQRDAAHERGQRFAVVKDRRSPGMRQRVSPEAPEGVPFLVCSRLLDQGRECLAGF